MTHDHDATPAMPIAGTPDCERALAEVERHRVDTRRLEHEFPGFAALATDLRSGVSPAQGRAEML